MLWVLGALPSEFQVCSHICNSNRRALSVPSRWVLVLSVPAESINFLANPQSEQPVPSCTCIIPAIKTQIKCFIAQRHFTRIKELNFYSCNIPDFFLTGPHDNKAVFPSSIYTSSCLLPHVYKELRLVPCWISLNWFFQVFSIAMATIIKYVFMNSLVNCNVIFSLNTVSSSLSAKLSRAFSFLT